MSMHLSLACQEGASKEYRQKNALVAERLAYNISISVDTIREDMLQLADLLAYQCFPHKAGGQTGLWAKAPSSQLSEARIRKRPRGAQTYAAPRLMQDVPSGGDKFNEKIPNNNVLRLCCAASLPILPVEILGSSEWLPCFHRYHWNGEECIGGTCSAERVTWPGLQLPRRQWTL